MKASRNSERQEAFKDTDGARSDYKVEVASVMEDRNKYRDMIEGRKIKEGQMLDLIGQDKADVATLKTTIEQAIEL